MIWDDTAIDRLTALWADGRSTRDIAAFFGTTKNAIIGKINRLGLSGKQGDAVAIYGAAGPKPMSLPAIVSAAPAPVVKTPKPKRTVMQMQEIAIPTARSVSLADLEPCSCRWPLGDLRSDDFAFCGAPAAFGKSYCPEHYARSVTPRVAKPDSAVYVRPVARAI